MDFWDYFYTFAFVFIILCVVYEIIILIVNSQRLKKISRKIAVKKGDIWCIVLSVIIALLSFEQYRMTVGKGDTNVERLHFLACSIAYIVVIFFDKHIYITPDGLFYKDMIKVQPKEKYRYKIDGDTLQLYYKQSDKPVKYRIAGDKEELIRILDENYEKYMKLNAD